MSKRVSSTPWTTSRRDDDGGKTRELGVCLSFCEWILPRRSPNSNGAAKSGQKRCCRMLPSFQSVIQQIRSQSDDPSMKIDSRLASYSSRLGFVQSPEALLFFLSLPWNHIRSSCEHASRAPRTNVHLSSPKPRIRHLSQNTSCSHSPGSQWLRRCASICFFRVSFRHLFQRFQRFPLPCH